MSKIKCSDFWYKLAIFWLTNKNMHTHTNVDLTTSYFLVRNPDFKRKVDGIEQFGGSGSACKKSFRKQNWTTEEL